MDARKMLWAVMAVVALAVFGCGGGGGSSSTDNPTPATFAVTTTGY